MFSHVSEISVYGAFFPAWLISIAAGIVFTLALHVVFVRARLAPHMGPPALIYPCLVLTLTMGTWLVFFSR